MREVQIDLAPGVELRSLRPENADTVYAVVDAERERLNPWMPWIHETAGPADILAFIERSLASEHDVEGNGIWVDGKFAGAAGLSVDPLFNSGDIGYWIGRAYEGRGIVTLACRALIDIAFNDLRLHRLTIHAAPDNVRSCAVAERLDFKREAVLREAGKAGDSYMDLVVFSLLDREWIGRGGPALAPDP